METGVENWVQRKVDELKERERLRSLENERIVIESRLRRHHAPRLFVRLKDWLKQACTQTNSEMKRDVFLFELVPQSQVTIRRLNSRRILQIVYDPDAQRIYYKAGNDSGEYLFLVQADSTVALGKESGVLYSVEDVGGKLLDLLLYPS